MTSDSAPELSAHTRGALLAGELTGVDEYSCVVLYIQVLSLVISLCSESL